jgi:Flp pilus assembly protein TadB
MIIKYVLIIILFLSTKQTWMQAAQDRVQWRAYLKQGAVKVFMPLWTEARRQAKMKRDARRIFCCCCCLLLLLFATFGVCCCCCLLLSLFIVVVFVCLLFVVAVVVVCCYCCYCCCLLLLK